MRLHAPVPHHQQPHLKDAYDAGGTVNSPLAGYQQGSGGIPNPMQNASAGMNQMGAGTSQATNAAGAAGNNSYGSWGNANAPITGSDPEFLGSTQSAGAPGTSSNNTFSPNSAAGVPNRPAVPTGPPSTPSTTASSGGGGAGPSNALAGDLTGGSGDGGLPVNPASISTPQLGTALGGNARGMMAFDKGGDVGFGDTSAGYSLNLSSIADAAKSVYAANTQMAGNIPAKPAGPGGDTPGTTQPAPGPIPLRPGQTPFGQRVSDAERGDASMGAKRGGIIPKRRGFWRGGPADNDGYKAAVADIAAKTDAETKREGEEDTARIQGGTQRDVANTEAAAKQSVANTAASASRDTANTSANASRDVATTQAEAAKAVAATPRVSYSYGNTTSNNTTTTNKGYGWKKGGLVKKRTGVKRGGRKR